MAQRDRNLTLTDPDGDELRAEAAVGQVFITAEDPWAKAGAVVRLDECHARELRDYLDAWLGEQAAEDPAEDEDETSVALEAHQAVYGDRGADYGHPRVHWTRTACLWTGLLQHKLAEGEHVTPEDVGRLYVADKLSRDVHAPKRDNRVDIAGYALCLDRLETGR